jgi:protein TonB
MQAVIAVRETAQYICVRKIFPDGMFSILSFNLNVSLDFHITMKNRIAIISVAAVLAGCASDHVDQPASHPADAPSHAARTEAASGRTSSATSIDGYKRDLALHISRLNARHVFAGRPQALLRSVVVLRYTIDARGRLTHVEVLRSNHDRVTETTALASLRNSAPFPKPAPRLLHRGRLDISETWLFNKDGRFQLRSVAEVQMDR